MSIALDRHSVYVRVSTHNHTLLVKHVIVVHLHESLWGGGQLPGSCQDKAWHTPSSLRVATSFLFSRLYTTGPFVEATLHLLAL